MEDRLARLLSPGQGAGSRVLVVVAHPDDEVLGCGGLLQRLPAVRVIHVTDGAPGDVVHARRHGFETRAAYAAARAAEAEVALALAGHPATCLTRLGVPDQDAPDQLVAITEALHEPVSSADLVLTHAYEGGHGDHDAVAFAVSAALRLGRPDRPPLVEMPFYRASLPGEGEEAGSGPDAPWTRQRFLPHPDAGPEHVLPLTSAEAARKRAMLAAHATQGATLAAFDATAERYRRAPRYHFTALPHGGDLLYERHGWRLTGPLWLERVAAACTALGLAAP